MLCFQIRESECYCDDQETGPDAGTPARKSRDEVQKVSDRLQVRRMVPRDTNTQENDGRTSGKLYFDRSPSLISARFVENEKF